MFWRDSLTKRICRAVLESVVSTVLACSRRSDSRAQQKYWRRKKNEERLGREGEEIALTPISARFPPRFPRVRFNSLPPSELRALLSERLQQDGTVPNFGTVQCEQLGIRTVESE